MSSGNLGVNGGELPRWIGSVLLTVAVHGALLAAAIEGRLVDLPRVELLRVSLLPGGGSGGDPNAAGAGKPAEMPSSVQAAPPAPQIVAARPAPERRRSLTSRPRIAKKLAARAPVRDDDLVNPAPTSISAAPPTGSGSGNGNGDRGGTGDGPGSGGGIGDGNGNGNGNGSGGDAIGRGYCVYCPEPSYPLLARRRGWSGTVDVSLVLLADGRVDSASVQHSSGHEELDHEAVEVARRSRFRLPNGSAAPTVHGRIEYRFELVGSQRDAE